MDIDNKEENIQPEKKISFFSIIKEQIKKYVPFVLELVKIAVIAFIIVAPIRYFIFQPFIVSGVSMAPNFASGDYLIIDEISYRFSEPKRGDVIVFNASFIKGYDGQRFIKRLIGLPGDNVNITSGQVKITRDEKTIILNEKYLLDSSKTYGDVNIKLNEDEYFVLGDNREYSYDSRMWGALPKKDIIGKAYLRIFPIKNITEISQPIYE